MKKMMFVLGILVAAIPFVIAQGGPSLSAAYSAGFDAGYDFWPRASPYEEGSQAAASWYEGYSKGREKREKEEQNQTGKAKEAGDMEFGVRGPPPDSGYGGGVKMKITF